MTKHILLAHGIVSTKTLVCGNGVELKSKQLIGTLLSNLAHYGYTLSQSIIGQLENTSLDCMRDFWSGLEPELKALTGADKNVSEFVVYKNFPKEVMELSAAEQFIDQILIYLGVPAKSLTQAPEVRDQMFESVELKVLSEEKRETLESFHKTLMGSRVKWADSTESEALALYKMFGGDLSEMPFKGNMITLALAMIEDGKQGELSFNSATDVLRLASGMSEGDITLRQKVKFRKFKNRERKFLVEMLEKCTGLKDDFAARKELWKRFLFQVRPSSYPKCVRVNEALNLLYKNKCKTFKSKVVALVERGDVEALELLKSRPGEFVRQVHAMYKVYGITAFEAFAEALSGLSLLQLVQINKYLETANDRKTLIYRPKGSWSNAIVETEIVKQKAFIGKMDLEFISSAISTEIAARLTVKFPNGVLVGARLNEVFLPTNDLELAPYGRGTSYDIPENINFLRTCSYWEVGENLCGNIWYDNGINLFDEKFNVVGTCSWNSQYALNKAVIMSGDPASSSNENGKAAQIIDVDIDKTVKAGARYALWSVLCYSRKTFAEAKDVFAALQMGEDAQSGGLFEPSRATLSFPIKGDNLTRYPALFDLVERKVIFLDIPLRSHTDNAGQNEDLLSNTMPSVMEHVSAQPTLADLFKHADNRIEIDKFSMLVDQRLKQDVELEALKASNDEDKQSEAKAFETVSLPTVILRDDCYIDLPDSVDGYVFNPINDGNNFNRLPIQKLIE